ncbi:MAG: hypothetical protein HOB26_07935, partial [Flavobacteriales bacterium]|nr:hypothetical protein [Flavobacteriales bacterium]
MNKKYNVYGIGNALVDIVTEVDDQFLQDHKIEKGLMTLVDEEHQTRISMLLTWTIVTCNAEALQRIQLLRLVNLVGQVITLVK